MVKLYKFRVGIIVGGGGGNLNHIFSSCFPCYTDRPNVQWSIHIPTLFGSSRADRNPGYFFLYPFSPSNYKYSVYKVQSTKKDLLYFTEKKTFKNNYVHARVWWVGIHHATSVIYPQRKQYNVLPDH